MKKSNTEVAQILNSHFKNVNFEIPSKEKFRFWGGENCAWLKLRVMVEYHVSNNFFKKFSKWKTSLPIPSQPLLKTFLTACNSLYPINGLDRGVFIEFSAFIDFCKLS